MSSYENSSLTEIEAVLDGLEEPTSAEVFDATRPYSARAIAAVAAKTADGAGGGGAEFPDGWTVGDDGTLVIATEDPAEIAFSLTTAADLDDYQQTFVVTATGGLLFRASSDGSFDIRLHQSDSKLRVMNAAGQSIFRVDGDGTVHIKTGTSIQADL